MTARTLVRATALVLFAGCRGEDKAKAPKPERAATSDWRALGDAACGLPGRPDQQFVADMRRWSRGSMSSLA